MITASFSAFDPKRIFDVSSSGPRILLRSGFEDPANRFAIRLEAVREQLKVTGLMTELEYDHKHQRK
jgi:hypothetical protein